PSHTGLLWALETLAWEPTLLERVTLLLGELARQDPGGRWANRPIASLRGIYLAWFPQTGATLQERLRVLDILISAYPEVAWKLLCDLLPPTVQDVAHPNPRPTYRASPLSDEPVTEQEYAEATAQIARRLLGNAGVLASRWTDLVERLVRFPLSLR